MSQYIDLDSILRDREQYPNENDYELSPQQVEGWFRNSRIVTPLPQNPNTYPLGFVTSISIVDLALPYSALLSTMPRVYINFTSTLYRDVNLVQSISSSQPSAKFVCKYDKTQYDSLNNPIWIHYKCDMDQVMRFERRFPVIFQVLTRSGNVLPQQDTDIPAIADPNKQSLCTFCLTPYIQDGKFDNQMVETLNTA